MKLILPLLLLPLFIFTSCSKRSTDTQSSMDTLTTDTSQFVLYNNPPADGFDQQGSDLIATLLADKVMIAMGGREAWDNTRTILWTFFGKRNHIWDKRTGDIRIEVPDQELTILMNIHTQEGQVQKAGEVLSDSVDYYLKKGYEMWINDSYWLVMPYKLKDTGVTLKYAEEGATLSGEPADVLELTFENVGVTPQNKYEVWVDTESKLITQWAYYPDSSSTEPRFITPWADYQTYGDILLSGDRGDGFQLTNIEVRGEMPEETFTQF